MKDETQDCKEKATKYEVQNLSKFHQTGGMHE